MNDYTKRLNAVSRDQGHKNRRPRDAATVIMLDRSEGAPRVLMGRRHDRHVFMPGKFVFPGGRVDRTDGRAPAARELRPQVMTGLMHDMKQNKGEHRARALALAAIREVFEETGIAIGRPHSGRRPGISQWRDFFSLGLAPDLSVLHLVARAITPPRRPRRFDTRFFAVDMTESGHSTAEMMRPCEELDQLVWIPIDEASRLDMPAITTVILEELGKRLETDPQLKAKKPIPYYRWVRDGFQRFEI